MKQVVRLSILALLVALIGCGGPAARTKITGKVQVAGKGPLPGGTIQFVLASDSTVVGGGLIKADGNYEVVDAPIGDCKVVIENEFLSGRTKSNIPTVPGMSKGPPGDVGKKMAGPPTGVEAAGSEKGSMTGGKYVKIDSSYSSAEKTPLKSAVIRGAATPSDFEVK